MGFHCDMGLYTDLGERKYLTSEEGNRFLYAATKYSPQICAFCFVLTFTGCRISEALMITQRHLDQEQGYIRLRTLKRRNNRIVWRTVPVPENLFTRLNSIQPDQDEFLFPWSRSTAWRKVKQVMTQAGIEGPHAVPKALRHRYGVTAASNRIPDALIQRWMGHAKLENTAIYQQAIGPEERQLAEMLWR